MDADIVQIALHEIRRPNPVSELEAFEGAIANGETVETIKYRTGIKQQRVRVLQRLGNLIAELRAALSDGRMRPSVAYLAAKLPKKDQRKLLAALKDTGRIKVLDIKEVQAVRKKTALAALPDSLFEDEDDWRVAALARLSELRAILEPRDKEVMKTLNELEKKIKN